MKAKDLLIKIKDWFIIIGIKIKNFIIEHKFVSSVIGVFLLSSVIAFTVFANTDEYEGRIQTTVNTINLKDSNGNPLESNVVKSFNSVVLDIRYILTYVDDEALDLERNVNLTAQLVTQGDQGDVIDNNIDAKWEKTDLVKELRDDDRTLIATVYDKKTGKNNEQSQNLLLNLYNIKNETAVNVKITLCESTSLDKCSSKTLTFKVESKKVELQTKILPGNAYKFSDDGQSGRYAPFGILVGFNDENNTNSLSGLYFDDNLEITLDSNQELITNEGYFGVYDRSKNLIDKAPNYIFDGTSNSVYNSGKVNSLSRENTGSSSEESNLITSQILYLEGDKSITLEVGNSYNDPGIKTSESGSATCKTDSSSCKIKLVNESGTTVTASQMIQNVGVYKESYTYGSGNDTTTIYRTINIVEKSNTNDSISIGGNNYTLNGDKNVSVLKGETYADLGILKNGSQLSDEDKEILSILVNGDIVNSVNIDTTKIGTYVIKYNLTSGSESNYLERIVKVIENTTPAVTKTPVVTTHSISKLSAESIIPSIKIDGVDKACNSENNCEVKYFLDSSLQTSAEEQIKNNVPGNYIARYTITDNDSYKIVAINNLSIQVKYVLSISGIKTDKIYYKNENFIGLGSYYVTAKSVREEGNTSDISVVLKATVNYGTNTYTSSGEIVNSKYSSGTKNYDLSFVDENDNVLSDDVLSYGENVILRSQFKYSSDGDDNTNITVKVPINISALTQSQEFPTGSNYVKFSPVVPFEMQEYFEEPGSSETPYYFFEAYKNGEKVNNSVSVEYYTCEILDSDPSKCSGDFKIYSNDSSNNNGDYSQYIIDYNKNNKLKLAFIKYEVKEIKPGTTVNFKVRLKANIGNQGGTVTLGNSSSSLCVYTQDSDSKQIFPEAPSINITAFKARAKVYIDDKDQDVVTKNSDSGISKWSIYPSVDLPAQNVNTNAAGINDLEPVIIEITLPEGINYIYNESYGNSCSYNEKGRKITCSISGKKVNDWFDSVNFDTSYDINIPTGTELKVPITISAETKEKEGKPKIKDTSSVVQRTIEKKIIYQNLEEIPFSLSSPYSFVSKNTSFDINTKIYNGTLKNQSLNVVMVLPYVDSDGKNTFSGAYKLSGIEDGMLCSTSPASTIMLKSDNVINDPEITWDECAKYKSSNYVGVTAIRINDISLDSNKIYDNTIKLIPSGNKTDDKYKINAFLYYTNGNDEIKKLSKSVVIGVASKKITGIVWEDFNADGIKDADEKLISGVTLSLYKYDDSSGEYNYQTDTISNEKGIYVFSDLELGKYYVVADYNTAKYGLSPQGKGDKAVSCSFKTEVYKYDVDNLEKQELEDDDIDSEDDFTDVEDDFDDDVEDDPVSEGEEIEKPIAKTDIIEVTNNTNIISDINLGLSLKKVYSVKLSKYISKVITTNKLGMSNVKDYGNVSLAKFDVKDISNLTIKVVYTIELENVGYYPGYIYAVKDYIPDGMSFNENYEENKGWTLNEEGYLENNTLFDQLVNSGEKKYLTIAFDVTRKEAGSFINYASVDDEDLHMLILENNDTQEGAGDSNE